MLTLLALAWLGTASAQDPATEDATDATEATEATEVIEEECDAEALLTTLEEAAGASVSITFEKLVACDEEAAKEAAPIAFEKMLPGKESYPSIILAIEMEAYQPVWDFIEAMQSDEMSGTVAYLGKQCEEVEVMPPFLVASYETLGDAFWEQRWHRGLSRCRTEEIRGLLSKAILSETMGKDVSDRALFLSVLEVYARNLRGDAIPTLQEFARSLDDEEEVVYVVSAFADAVGVGSTEGVEPEVSAAAIKALIELGPDLPVRAVEQARTTLMTLDAEREADGYAKYRWPAEYRTNGYKYRYAATAIEHITCKNGKQTATLHYAEFTEPGNLWPEQIADLILDKIEFEWELDTPVSCGGERKISYDMPAKPFSDDADRDAWFEEVRRELKTTTIGYKKVKETEHEAFEL